MPLTMEETPGGSLANAHYLATASDLAYYNDPEGAQKFKSDLALDAKLFSVGNTQVYVATDDAHIIAVFRGTEAPTSIEGLKDWLLTDANNYLILPEGQIGTDFAAAGVGARFHRGFMTALSDIWGPVCAAVEAELQKKERPLWVTGHSLGGALALLAAWRFLRKTMDVYRVYTFGGPMVGNEAAVKAFDREMEGKIYRFVHGLDLVPKLPTISLVDNAYGHCTQEVHVGVVDLARAADESAAGFFSQMAAGADKALDTVRIDKIWNRLLQGISAHDIVKYRERIVEKMNEKA
jgi:triacylglycerol lipase